MGRAQCSDAVQGVKKVCEGVSMTRRKWGSASRLLLRWWAREKGASGTIKKVVSCTYGGDWSNTRRYRRQPRQPKITGTGWLTHILPRLPVVFCNSSVLVSIFLPPHLNLYFFLICFVSPPVNALNMFSHLVAVFKYCILFCFFHSLLGFCWWILLSLLYKIYTIITFYSLCLSPGHPVFFSPSPIPLCSRHFLITLLE